MNCTQFRLLLDEQLDGALERSVERDCLAHVAACAACAARRADALQLQEALATLPAPALDPAFAARAFAVAHSAQPARAAAASQAPRRRFERWAGGFAVAATLVLGVGTWTTREVLPEIRAVGNEPVRLVFRSESAVSDVTIELELPEGVELAGYPGQRRLVWQSDLQAGSNLLELPVRMNSRSGVVRATINHGDEQRRFAVRLVASGEAEAARPAHAVINAGNLSVAQRSREQDQGHA